MDSAVIEKIVKEIEGFTPSAHEAHVGHVTSVGDGVVAIEGLSKAVISSVDPEYDAKTGTIDVRLRLAQFPPGTHDLPLGAPVRVSMQIENRNRVRTFLTAIAGEQRMKEISDWIASIPAPFTNAQDR
jgi:hypothetical protein